MSAMDLVMFNFFAPLKFPLGVKYSFTAYAMLFLKEVMHNCELLNLPSNKI